MNLERILSEQRAELEAIEISSLCPRHEEKEIHLESKLAQIVIGVRRSGKSTLCQKVLLQSGVKFAYVNFDDERLAGIGKEQLDKVLETLYRLFGDFSHLFMDEVQNIEGWPLFVNRLLRQGIKLVLTGSNANLLSGELSTHLTGRYHQIELFPFSFNEYCQAVGVDINHKTTKAEGLRLHALDKYLFDGGFPELLEVDAPMDYVRSLISAIVTKDISRRYNIRYKQTLSDIANGMLDKFCQEISIADLTRDFQIKSEHTTKNYINYLETAYLVCTVPKYSFKSRERQLFRKYYAVDTAFISRHANLQTENMGWRLENVVAVELLRRMNREFEQLYYLHKNKDFEVDFVVVSQSKVKELIQVTYDFSTPTLKLRNREVGGLIKGAKMTGCNQLTLIMMKGEKGMESIDGYTIKKTLATDWLLM